MEGMHTNAMFIAVMAFIIGLQCFVMVAWNFNEQIPLAFSVHRRGITGEQWLWSVIVGLITIPINFGLKFVPEEWAFVMGDEPVGDVQKAADEYAELKRIAAKY